MVAWIYEIYLLVFKTDIYRFKHSKINFISPRNNVLS